MNFAPSDSVAFESTSCELLITTRCNMICKYCIAQKLGKLDMTKEIGEKAIDFFLYLSEGAKVVNFTFTGGEPLLDYQKLEYLIRYAIDSSSEKGMGSTISIKTNGLLIEEKQIEMFKKYKCTIFISIDGIKEIHNKYRVSVDNISYNIAMKNIKLLSSSKINCIASMTVLPSSVRYLTAGIQNLINNGICNINLAPAYGTVVWHKADVNIYSQSMINVANIIRIEKSKYPEIEIGPIFKNTEHKKDCLKDVWGCNAGSSNIAILPNGDITGCSALAMITPERPELIIGNVLSGIDQNRANYLVEIAEADYTKRANCKNCKTKNNCYGGCLAINYSTNNNALKSPTFYCELIKTIPDAWELAWGDENS